MRGAALRASLDGTDKLVGGLTGALGDLLSEVAESLKKAAAAGVVALVTLSERVGTQSEKVASADQSVRNTLMQHTTANTGTSVTPTAIDASAMSAIATALENCSAEGTYTAGSELLDQAIHLQSLAARKRTMQTPIRVLPALIGPKFGQRC